jgi:hypothetical protein
VDFWAVHGYFAIFGGPFMGFKGTLRVKKRVITGFFGQIFDLQSLVSHAKPMQYCSLLRHEMIATSTAHSEENFGEPITSIIMSIFSPNGP